MEADNLDQVSSMSDHEMHILGKVSVAMSKMGGTPKKTLWEAVWEEISKTALSTFSRHDCKEFYSLARTLAHRDIALITLYHFHFVNPSVLRVHPEMLGDLSALADKYAISKVAVIAFSYMVAEEHYDHVGNICYAVGVKKDRIGNLAGNTPFSMR